MNDIVQPGFIFVLTEGEYSDYGIRGFVKVLKPFISSKLVDEFKEQYVEPEEVNSIPIYAFELWLVEEGYVEPVDNQVGSWHLGSYGELS